MGEPTKASDRSPAALGFLTVVEHEQLGLTGGYLILNTSGRPLEFHCTAPVKPSRAQQILFGPTLTPYLYGEQIAQTLIAKGSIEPLIVWTDQAAVLSVRDHVSLPVALVLASAAANGEDSRRPDPSNHFDAILEFTIGRYRVAVPLPHDSDREHIAREMSPLATFDLQEPFGRIREAVEEAQRAAGNRVQAA